MNLPCKVTSRKKVFILLQTKATSLKFISMGFGIFYNSQNLKEITLKVYHFYKSTSAPFVSQSLHTHHYHSKVKRFYTTCFILVSCLSRGIQFYRSSIKTSHDVCPLFHALSCACIVDCTLLYF